MIIPVSSNAAAEATITIELAEKPVVLMLPKSVQSNYDVGASELRAELEIAELEPQLLMQVCLAAPAVDDLILGFIRDDLRVVSCSEQTRNVFERDIALAQKDAGKNSKNGTQNRPLLDLALAKSREARADEGSVQRGELDRFIKENPKVYQEVAALSQEDLARWVMLSLMREMDSRRRGSLAIAAWKQTLAPEIKQRIDLLRTNLNLKQTGPTQSLRPGGVRAKF